MKLKHLIAVLVLTLIIYQLIEIYVINSIEPAYIEVSKLETGSNRVQFELRVYFPNPYFLRVNLYTFTAKIDCSGKKGTSSQKFNVTLLPRQTNIFTMIFSATEDMNNCTLFYSWIPDLTFFSLLNIHILNFTKTLVFPGVTSDQIFIWAGWNATEINQGDCVSLQVYTYPSSSFEVEILSDYLSMPPATLSTFRGIGEGSFTFCPKEPSSFKLKGYYLRVVSSGKTWVQADSYPPRLRVSP